MHFSELVKRICHLLAVRRQICPKTAIFWSVKSQGILFLYEGGHPGEVCPSNAKYHVIEFNFKYVPPSGQRRPLGGKFSKQICTT